MIDGFVLAGGASRRMGGDKARVPRRGWPAAAVSAAILLVGGCDRVALVRREPEPGWTLPVESWVSDPGAPLSIILDPVGVGRHPLWGVVAALRSSSAERCVICACDLWFGPEDVRRLLATSTECVAVDPGGGFGLFLVLRPDRAESIEAMARAGAPLRALAARLPTVALSEDALANHNTATRGSIRAITERFGERAGRGERARLAARGATDPDDPG